MAPSLHLVGRRRGSSGTVQVGLPPVLERDRELAELASAVERAAAGRGSTMLVFGEAGIGKSTLVDAVWRVLPERGRMLVGHCDDLATPRTLGPFRDLIGSVGGELAMVLRDHGDRDRLLDALRAELASFPGPTVLAVEDVHWADDATLDVLCYLVRRVADLPVVLLLTYREGDLDADHPLLRVLGRAVSAGNVRRLPLARLSEASVRRLAATSRLDPREVHEVTAGNPFFVAELLAAGDLSRVPPSVVSAVLARVQRLDVGTRLALEQLAVVPSALDDWLPSRLVDGGIAAVAAAEAGGLLDVSPHRVSFRHELIRRAIADSLPVARRVQLNRRVLAVLVGREGSDLSRIMHHASEAGDVDTIVRYGPPAAYDAIAAGSHREAAAYLRLVLEHRDRFDPAERADLLGRYAVECNRVAADVGAAVTAQQEAVDLRRTLGDSAALGADLRWLSRFCWVAGEPDRMRRSAEEAVAVLESAGDQRLLALALSNQSQVHMFAHRLHDSIRVGEHAITVARTVADPAVLSQALNTVGVARRYLGLPGARALLEESLSVAKANGATEEACRAYANITQNLLGDLRLDAARQYIADAIDLAEGAEHLSYLYHYYARRAALHLTTGTWDQAVSDAQLAIDAQPPANPGTRATAQCVLGRVLVRRGNLDGERLLSEAWKFAERVAELQHRSPVGAALAEAAWLRGDEATLVALIRPLHADACRLGAVALRAELDYWMSKAGLPVAPVASKSPYTLLAAGRWREAAAVWHEAGCPYEYAMALAESVDPDDLLASLTGLDTLGAEPLARRVRQRLRDLGVTRVPRGPATTTRSNPAGLTDRQLQVALLLGKGHTNAEIADRLVLSERTIENHVAAVFDKLDVHNRRDIAARLATLDLPTEG
jgi:DNA-binding CsgD family transcriptional regulator/tetratricopeptide (TPR) repeat protein